MNCMTVRPRELSLNRPIDRFFEDWFKLASGRDVSYSADFSPRVNIRETDDKVALTFELPGMNKNDIKVVVKDGVLNVSGQREFKNEEKNDEYVRRELRSGSFSRSFTLPDTIDADKIDADYKNGLLEVVMSKREEVKPKEVEVKIS